MSLRSKIFLLEREDSKKIFVQRENELAFVQKFFFLNARMDESSFKNFFS